MSWFDEDDRLRNFLIFGVPVSDDDVKDASKGPGFFIVVIVITVAATLIGYFALG